MRGTSASITSGGHIEAEVITLCHTRVVDLHIPLSSVSSCLSGISSGR
jgi:hypothetical protein